MSVGYSSEDIIGTISQIFFEYPLGISLFVLITEFSDFKTKVPGCQTNSFILDT
jgi:hypothetical protein